MPDIMKAKNSSESHGLLWSFGWFAVLILTYQKLMKAALVIQVGEGGKRGTWKQM